MFNPEIISYKKLLKVFFNSHNPARQSGYQQYMNILFYHTKQQKKQARSFISSLEKEKNMTVQTRIDPAGTFYPAENYHQKYYLQGHDQLMNLFKRSLDSFDQIVDSRAAALVNGYLGNEIKEKELLNRLQNPQPGDNKKLFRKLENHFAPEKSSRKEKQHQQK